MKRILHFGGVLLALGMLLASCNIGVGDGQVSGDSVRNTSNVEGITIGISNIDNTGRTILPADWNDGTAEKLTYELYTRKSGTANGNMGWAPKKTFSYSQLKSGTAVVNLDLIEWDLKLVGYLQKDSSTDSDLSKPCLEKELLNQNFSSGKKTVVFDLKPVDTTTTSATGKVDVTIVWLTTQPKRIEFGIYDTETERTTEDIVGDKGRGNVFSGFKKIITDEEFVKDGTAYKHTWEQNDVPAGMYKFAAVFYDNDDDTTFTGNVIGYYIDYLYVDGGNDSIATVNYGDKFNTQPDNPTWLAVETVFVPQKLTDPDDPVNNEYYAKFHWNDVSNNETGFELVINDGANDYVVNSKKDDNDNDLLISDKWYNGPGIDDTIFNTTTDPNTLDAGRTWVVLKLKTETLYTAKIRAINKYTPAYVKDAPTQDSDIKFCENLNRNGDGQGRTYAPIVTEGTGTTAKKQFGMFSVNYALSGGNVIEKKGADATDASITNYVVGFNYSSQQQDLMTDNILSYPHVSKPGSNFDYWDNDNPPPEAESPRLDVISAKNKDNLELTAVWAGSDVRVYVTFPSYAEAKDVKIVKDKNSDNTFTFTYDKDPTNTKADKNTITIDAGDSLKVGTVKFELTEMGNTGKIIATGTETVTDTVYGTIKVSSKKWTWEPTEKTTPGFYCLQIIGDYEDAGSGRTLKLCGNIYIEVLN